MQKLQSPSVQHSTTIQQLAPVAYVARTQDISQKKKCEECGLSNHTMDHCWVKHPHLRPILHCSRSRSITRNSRDKGRPPDHNKPRESTVEKGKENRVLKEYGKKKK